jgi:hypothetical protein
MQQTIQIKGTICVSSQHGQFMFFHGDVDGGDYGYIPVCKHTIELPMPADFHPAVAEAAALERKLKAVEREHAHQVRTIKDRIASLRCIENSPTETA